jgi:hypothetical protein
MNWGDTKAVIVGAGTADEDHEPQGFSTYGSRVNVHSWGDYVFTLGYGDFSELGNDKNQRYTEYFGGTSSASGLVGPSCAALQSLAVDILGRRLTPLEMRELLMDSGIPQGGEHHIGPAVDLKAASIMLCDYGSDQTDTDDDGVADLCDNCASTPNPLQGDVDVDGDGDYCDDDADSDSILNADDNCWLTPNTDQVNSDTDSLGDACDNCPYAYNPYQYDRDENGLGDVCDWPRLLIQCCLDMPQAVVGEPYYYQFWVINGVEPLHWSKVLGAIPLGLTLDQNTGVLSGIPTYEFMYAFSLAVTDSDDPPGADAMWIMVDVVGSQQSYICGDADDSGGIDIDDAVYLIAYIFSGGPAPDPVQAGDVDCSGGIDIDDVVYLIAYIFASGPVPCADCPE